MRFASLHDLELRHLMALVMQEHQTVVKEIEAAGAELTDDAELQRLAHEMYRRETAHLALLTSLSSDRSIELASSSSQTRRQIQKTPSITTAA
jgi:hypothetical protein